MKKLTFVPRSLREEIEGIGIHTQTYDKMDKAATDRDIPGRTSLTPVETDTLISSKKRVSEIEKELSDAGVLPTDKPYTGTEKPGETQKVTSAALRALRLSEKAGEAIKEDMDTENLPGPENQENTGLANLLVSLIQDEWETVTAYQNVIDAIRVQYSDSDYMLDALEDILNEENVHIGQLQKLLSTVSPVTAIEADKDIEIGKQEGALEEDMDTHTNTRDDVLNALSDCYSSLKTAKKHIRACEKYNTLMSKPAALDKDFINNVYWGIDDLISDIDEKLDELNA